MITTENLKKNYTSVIVYSEIKNDYFKLLLFISNFNICGLKSLHSNKKGTVLESG